MAIPLQRVPLCLEAQLEKCLCNLFESPCHLVPCGSLLSCRGCAGSLPWPWTPAVLLFLRQGAHRALEDTDSTLRPHVSHAAYSGQLPAPSQVVPSSGGEVGFVLPFPLTIGGYSHFCFELNAFFLTQNNLYPQGSAQGPLLQEASLDTHGLSLGPLRCLCTFLKLFEIDSHFVAPTDLKLAI